MAAVHRVDVIVVGGGMVGAATALALAQADLDVAVVHREPPVPLAAADPS